MNKPIKSLAILFFLFVCGCASHTKVNIGTTPLNLPKPEELGNRIIQLYEAEMKHDWQAWYNITTLKNEISYEEYLKSMESQKIDYEIISCSAIGFVEKPVSKNNVKIKAAVAVAMDVEIKRNLLRTEKVKDQTDYWVFTNNSWYWTWRGFPAD